MKTSICNELFRDWPIEKVFDYAASLGFAAVELAPFTLGRTVDDISPARRKEIVAAANSAGVEIAGLHWLLVQPEGLYINHPDKPVRERTQEYLKKLIHLCGDLGGRVLVHGSPQQRTVQEGWDHHACWEHARETWAVCAETAGERGVAYCLEALTAQETNFLVSLEEAVRMAGEIGHPNLKAMFDCRAVSHNGSGDLLRDLEAALKTGQIGHVHLNDPNGRGPGFGRLRFAPLLKTLAQAGYRDYISIEVFHFEPDPETIAARSLGYLHGIMEAQGLPVKPAEFGQD